MGDVIPMALSGSQSPLLEQTYEFARVLDEALGAIAKTLRSVEAGHWNVSSLCALNTDLLDLLRSVGRDQQIEAAVDQVYEAARRLTYVHQRTVAPEHERYTDLTTAYLRLRQKVIAARQKTEES